MTQLRQSRRVSWELIALLVLAVLVLAAVIRWYVSPKGQGELIPPDASIVDAVGGLPSGTTEDGRPYLGDPDAPITVYDFSDFQCPYCRSFVVRMLPEILDAYVAPGHAKIVFVTVGFDGPESWEAGKAALCALAQGRFWQMHDWLYANQTTIPNSGAFSRKRLLAMATAAGADPDQVAACMDDPEIAARLTANESFARSQSVDATPNFLVGDRLIEGADVDALKSVLDDAMNG